MGPGSGGWSFPRPGNKAAIDSLPEIQLYNLKSDPGEVDNQQAKRPEIVSELKTLLTKYINDGRSTPGPKQENDPVNFEWKQISLIE